MKSKSASYWEGMAIGLFAGIVTGVFWPRLFGSAAEPSAHRMMQAINHAPEDTKSAPFVSRRDGPESAGDPALVAGVADKSALEFRTPGAPGARSHAERLTMPGQPGQEIDPERRVRVATRTVGLDGKSAPRPHAVRKHPPKASAL